MDGSDLALVVLLSWLFGGLVVVVLIAVAVHVRDRWARHQDRRAAIAYDNVVQINEERKRRRQIA